MPNAPGAKLVPAVLVTLITIDTVVDVSVHTLMVAIGGRLGVAVRALEDGIVAGIGVAGCADTIGPTMARVEPSMVEGCTRPPGHYLMAGLTRGGESGRHVVRIVRAEILGFVARIAVTGNRGVVVVHMAVGARNLEVRAHQREACVVVIERSRLPRGGAVAHLALLRESSGDVIRIRGAVVILQVAADTRRSGQVVVVVLVTIGAL